MKICFPHHSHKTCVTPFRWSLDSCGGDSWCEGLQSENMFIFKCRPATASPFESLSSHSINESD
ncbi:hypothetical protein [uncultured Parabacteroides sp.]|uniref:hypothetical protein n=1 Tax=uncultured Parabacteroides sp. TaxID=512312 RepID=UPI002658325C|nr:hypothetical protein [uncultured Parabacteroides sp.]